MNQVLQDFIILLRKSGIRVCVSEALDCINGLEYIELIDKSQFKNMLESTLIKRHEDHPEFERLFRLYFEKYQNAVENSQTESIMEKALLALENSNDAFSSLFRKFMLKGAEGIIPYIFKPMTQFENQDLRYPVMAAYSSMRMIDKIDQDGWADQINNLTSLIKQQGITEEEIDAFQAFIEKRIQHIHSLIQDFIKSEKNNWKNRRAKFGDETLLKKSFGSLSHTDIEAIRDAVYELVKRVRDEYSLRQRRFKLGKIDIKRTLRKSQRYGGVPIEIIWKKKKKSKDRIVVLCDVSDSVKNAAQFMLTLLYSFQDQFSKVRSFVFISELGEVTKFFDDHQIERGIYEALHNADIHYCSNTNYGNVLLQFYENYFDIINTRTTVIFIGDGRNNYSSSREWILEKMKSKARRIIWLNPERKWSWGTGDSVILSYKKHCNEVRECWNVSQLMDFINELVL